jgi:membrane associated rhomboid family serine protease
MVPAPVGHHCPTCIAEARAEYRRGPGRRIAVANAKGITGVRLLLISIGAAFVVETLIGGAGSLFDGPGAQTLVRLGASVQAARTSHGDIVGVATGQYWRLFTSMFLHFGIFHVGVNAYSLFILGTILEREVGRGRFLALYLVTGLCASAASYAFAPIVPTVSAGASGAIFGVFGAFLGYAWRRRHTAMGAAWLRAGGQIIILNLIINIGLSSVLDWRAHLGGLIAGIVAGFAVDARGSQSTRNAAFALGMLAIVAVTIALVVWRTAQLRAQLGL